MTRHKLSLSVPWCATCYSTKHALDSLIRLPLDPGWWLVSGRKRGPSRGRNARVPVRGQASQGAHAWPPVIMPLRCSKLVKAIDNLVIIICIITLAGEALWEAMMCTQRHPARLGVSGIPARGALEHAQYSFIVWPPCISDEVLCSWSMRGRDGNPARRVAGGRGRGEQKRSNLRLARSEAARST
jgi:hypothetical protein